MLQWIIGFGKSDRDAHAYLYLTCVRRNLGILNEQFKLIRRWKLWKVYSSIYSNTWGDAC